MLERGNMTDAEYINALQSQLKKANDEKKKLEKEKDDVV